MGLFLVGITVSVSNTEDIKLNQGEKFKEINKIKKKSFNFDKKTAILILKKLKILH